MSEDLSTTRRLFSPARNLWISVVTTGVLSSISVSRFSPVAARFGSWPVARKVLEIWSSRSVLSVTITMRAEGLFMAIALASITIVRLFPEP